MKELFEESQRNCDIHEMLNVTMAILNNYNDGDPYIALPHFATASKQIQPNGEALTRDMQIRTQYHTCYECETEMEVEFQPEGDSDYASEECPECSYETEYEYYYD
jgi:ssDNA-binding Zn-finger/Zn-ribbon topoisomerase 1